MKDDMARVDEEVLNGYVEVVQGNLYSCKSCQYNAPKRDMIRHVDASHLDTRYPCMLCDRVLGAGFHLERHLKLRHGLKNRIRRLQLF